jgi:histidinol-phosphate aminotransferase
MERREKRSDVSNLPVFIKRRHQAPRYAGVEKVAVQQERFDLAAGESPFGPPEQYFEIRRRLELSGAFADWGTHYREVDTSKAADFVRERFGSEGNPLSEEVDVIFSAQGSYGILREIPGMFSPNAGVRVWGIGPHFPSLDVFLMSHRQEGALQGRMRYGPIYSEDLYATSQETLIRAETLAAATLKKDVVWYLCNPGTPKGDSFAKEDLKIFIDLASRKGHLVIVDEAFGDSLPDEESAIPLVKNNARLIVLRSLGKLLGMPGERLGFAAMNRKLGEIYRENQLVYDMPGPSQLVSNEILNPGIIVPFTEQRRQMTEDIKGEFLDELKRSGVPYLPTELSVPILTVDGGGTTFHRRLAERGVKTTGGAGFSNTHPEMSNRYVRLTIPKDPSEIPAIVRILKNARKLAMR